MSDQLKEKILKDFMDDQLSIYSSIEDFFKLNPPMRNEYFLHSLEIPFVTGFMNSRLLEYIDGSGIGGEERKTCWDYLHSKLKDSHLEIDDILNSSIKRLEEAFHLVDNYKYKSLDWDMTTASRELFYDDRAQKFINSFSLKIL